MDKKNYLKIFTVGIALFSMFFGGGNLTFPLWIGSTADKLFPTTVGFILTGVVLPFMGVLVAIHFHGDHEKCLSIFGKKFGQVLIFSLLLFWIPLGSGPRCNQLAYGAFQQMGGNLSMWVYSALYSVVVFFLAYRRNKILDILGRVITPLLLCSLGAFIALSLQNISQVDLGIAEGFTWPELRFGLQTGYLSQDFIASIFFTSSILALVRENQKDKMSERSVTYSFLIGIALLSIVYIGMILVGSINASFIQNIPRDQLLVALGRALFHQNYHLLISVVITLSVLTTSVALALVYADYLRSFIFKEKIGHVPCVAMALLLNYLLSTIGFEPLATLISCAMNVLYPTLLVTSIAAVVKTGLKTRQFL